MSDQSRKLRIGLFVESLTPPAWVHRIVNDVQNSTCAEITLVVRNEAGDRHLGLLSTLVSDPEHALWHVYSRLDRNPLSWYPNPLIPAEIGSLVKGSPVLSFRADSSGTAGVFSSDDLARIHSYDLDVALSLGFQGLGTESYGIARYGVWTCVHDDDGMYRGEPSGFWELMERNVVTGSSLTMLTPSATHGKTLARSWVSTDLESVCGNRSKYYWKSASLVARKLWELYEQGPSCLANQDVDAEYRPYSSRLYKTPTNGEMLAFLAKVAGRKLTRSAWNRTHLEQWYLAYKFSEPDGMPDTLHDLRSLRPRGDRFWADPFPVEVDGTYYIFLEEYLYSKMRAHISVMQVDRHGNATEPVPILVTDYHLSYPFVFQWNGHYYMIPESKRNRDIRLYRCVDFPLQWEFETALMQGVPAVDTTLHEQDGLWWLFCNMGGIDFSTNEELFLFYADSPLGPWRPHKKNPIKSDVRSSRPAGRLFSMNGNLYRPSQDCSVRMGGAIVINRITTLTTDRFSETEVGRIEPGWTNGIYGVHTLNRARALTVVDCFGYWRTFP